MCVYRCVYIFVYIYIYMSVLLCTSLYLCVHVCACECACVCACVYMSVCMCVSAFDGKIIDRIVRFCCGCRQGGVTGAGREAGAKHPGDRSWKREAVVIELSSRPVPRQGRHFRRLTV